MQAGSKPGADPTEDGLGELPSPHGHGRSARPKEGFPGVERASLDPQRSSKASAVEGQRLGRMMNSFRHDKEKHDEGAGGEPGEDTPEKHKPRLKRLLAKVSLTLDLAGPSAPCPAPASRPRTASHDFPLRRFYRS